jgi:hypothetical protein
MIFRKNNFYVLSLSEFDNLNGFDVNGNKVSSKLVDVIFYHTGEDMESEIEGRLCTELEKEYWLDSMDIIDETIPNQDFGAVSLCDFEDWKKQKGYSN